MNGVHDMGGEHGMGPIQYEKDEPVFHAAWEGRVYAMNRVMGAWRKWNLDASRHQIESLPPADYFRMSYYERWTASLIGELSRAVSQRVPRSRAVTPRPARPKQPRRLRPPMWRPR